MRSESAYIRQINCRGSRDSGDTFFRRDHICLLETVGAGLFTDWMPFLSVSFNQHHHSTECAQTDRQTEAHKSNKKAQLKQGLRATAARVCVKASRNLSSARNPTLKRNIKSIGKLVAKLCHFCISKVAVSRHLGFLQFESCTIRSTNSETPS